MEQMMACLLAEFRTNQERMEANSGAEIKTIQEKMGLSQEVMAIMQCNVIVMVKL
jgi:DNA-binding transcriptional regulator YiaG